jgi:hypothetical protein
MPRPKRWIPLKSENGIQEFELSAWKYFPDFVTAELLDFPQFIYRGQPSAAWPLEPSLDRALRLRGRSSSLYLRERHLNEFRLATRGRRGSNPSRLEEENEWWALGQHQGLATPLLDWTSSPYVAAYFAFEEQPSDKPGRRAVFAIDVSVFEAKSAEITAAHSGPSRPFIVEFVRPMQDENSRLVSQGGLFTRAPDGTDIESWVRRQFPKDESTIVLMKVTIPSADRVEALRGLNRMNINRASLFPDLAGASAFCNLALMVDKY